MLKKLFALATLTAITGLGASIVVSGCTSTTIEEVPSDGGGATDARTDARPTPPKGDGGGTVTDPDADAPPADPGTSGKLCTASADCEGNRCSKGLFTVGDIYPDPICIYANDCTEGTAGTLDDLLCDNGTGTCLNGDTGQGLCLPACLFNSTGFEQNGACQGNNKCSPAYLATKQDGAAISLGVCYGGCKADADCKGSPDQKCQVESAICVKSANHVVYAKAVGAGCNAAAQNDECNCNSVGGNGADKDKGYCTSACITGAAGDTACNALQAGWKCSAFLPAKDNTGKTMFTANPPDILGACAAPCTVDADCAALNTAVGAAAGTYKCSEFAGGSFCNVPTP